MSKNDQGYRSAIRRFRGGGGGGCFRSQGPESERRTFISKTRKDELADMLMRTQITGILDVLGDGISSDERMTIRKAAEESIDAKHKTKEQLADELDKAQISAQRNGHQAFLDNRQRVEKLAAAAVLIDALVSVTRSTERIDLDEGEWVDDLPSLMLQGEGWGDEQVRGQIYRKHVNLCIDNSGSTHMETSGYCAAALARVARNLEMVLAEAAKRFPGVTWDVFSFNGTTKQHTGRRGREYRAQLMTQSLERVEIDDPLTIDARYTHLAPLVEALLKNEVERDLIGQPRLDIILTDGEFESQNDANAAAEWQRQRGVGVNTYVINICPELPSHVVLPQQFSVVPLECMTDSRIKAVDEQVLRRALMRIVLAEVARTNAN